ncbi:MAG: TonB-dependent receptor [Pseudomonadota bacterium]
MNQGLLLKTLIVSSTALTSFNVKAVAQDADSTLRRDEIVVTANKREQPLSTVAGSVAAITRDQIELIGAQDATAFLGRVAGLSIETSQPGFNRFVIRGVNAGGQFGFRQGSGTALYFDDTPLTTRANFFFASPDINLFDLERVEVLRGPQGTLFGSSAIGGAVRAVPRRPDYTTFSGSLEGEGSYTRDAGDPNYAVRASLNMPIIDDKLALRIVGEQMRNDGFIDAVLITGRDFIKEAETAPRIRDYNDQERTTIRAALGWQANNWLEVTPSVLFQNNRAGGAGDFALNAFGNSDRATIFEFNPAFEADGRDYEFVDDELFIGTIKAEAALDMLGGLSLVSVTSYQDRTASARDDAIAANGGFVAAYGLGSGFDGVDPFFSEFGTEVQQITQELRVVTTGAQRLQFVGGLYFNQLDQTDTIVYSFEGASQATFDNFGIVTAEAFDGRDEFREDEHAIFANAEYAITDKLKVTAGARLTYYEQVLSRGAAFPAFDDPGDLNNPSILRAEETKLTPRAIISYEPRDGLLLYTSAAEGFRTGGGNPPENLRGGCPNRTDFPEQPDQFDADSAWSYEIGGKFQSPDGSFSLNATAFRVDWSDIQTAVLFTCSDNSVISFVDNAGDARIEGVELEANLAVSPELTFFTAIGYTNDRFTESVPEAGAVDGEPLGYVPEWTANIGVNYEATRPIFGAWRPYATADYRFVASRDDPNFGQRSDPDFGIDLPAQNILDARVGIRHKSVDVSLFARNLADEDVALQQLGLFAPDAFQPTGFDTRGLRENIVLRPRTIGVSARVKF